MCVLAEIDSVREWNCWETGFLLFVEFWQPPSSGCDVEHHSEPPNEVQLTKLQLCIGAP